MAGLLYLPRIFVYHVENKKKKEATDIFEVMEKKLFFYIMRPAMIFTWIFGLILIYLNGIEILTAPESDTVQQDWAAHRATYPGWFDETSNTLPSLSFPDRDGKVLDVSSSHPG